MAWNGPHQDWHHASVPFWEFIASLDPSNTRGAGVDHAAPPPPPFFDQNSAGFGPGFPFGPGGFEGFGRRGGWGRGPWGRGGRQDGEDWAGEFEGRRGSFRGRRGGRGGRYGRGGREDPTVVDITMDEDEAAPAAAADNEKEDSPNTMRDANDDPPEEVPNPDESPRCRHRHAGGRGGRGGRGGFRGRHRFGPHPPPPFPFGPGPDFSEYPHPPPPPPFGGPFGGPFGHPRGFGHHPPPPPPFNFDINRIMQGLAQHPFAQQLREYLERAQNVAAAARGQQPAGASAEGATAQREGSGSDTEGEEDVESFTPPVDIFDTESAWVIHMAVPGAKKEDVGVNWDAERGLLGVSGVIHRPGDEAFQQSLVSGERRVGLFNRDVRLPPEGSESKEEVDAYAITAKMEDGVLVVTVPKVEKEWEEVTKVNIE
ncbi:hypothetical protein NKR23_g7359 [Pleurostoma richardsiae]|uniref:SHSP domain-containing protein n=1 Tax=Pleurostoma richardsiae TaxID=41990 RepID=A0AA38VGV1_9PEZI|nr:hypothetical protein NKR23_g7359 [Pleurostoma richardsiae]